jgi:hypothetical protein
VRALFGRARRLLCDRAAIDPAPYAESFKCCGACAYNVRDFSGLAVFVAWEDL